MQGLTERSEADARLLPFTGKRIWQTVFLGSSLTVMSVGIVLLTAFTTTSEDGVRALNIDFRVFWAAARLALQGEALAVFDMTRLGAEHNVSPEAWMPWLYPPGYLILVAPFGAMPFALAMLVSTLVSLGLMAWAVRSFTPAAPAIWVAMVLAPAYIPALVIGQNSLLWLAGLLAALAALRDQRWVLAGVLIGCLTLKPQLGLMIPVALLAAGLWRTTIAASLTALLVAFLPTLAFGGEYWPLLASHLAEQLQRLLSAIGDLYLMVGPFHLFTALGLPAGAALLAQWVVTAAMAVFVFLLWRNPRAGFDAKVAGLLLATLLSAPYLWHYEAAIMAVVGLFLVRAGVLIARPAPLVLLVLLWLGAAVQTLNVFLRFGDGRWLGSVIVIPVLLLSLILLLLHLRAAARPAHPLPAVT